MTVSEGGLLGPVTLVHENGASFGTSLMDLLLVGDGYLNTPADQAQFDTDCGDVVGWLAGEPWHSEQLRYRIFKQFVWSLDQGADNPDAPGGPTVCRTYFDARHGSGGLNRLLYGTSSTAVAVANEVAPEVQPYFAFEKVCVLVNTDTYGGACGSAALWFAARNPSSKGLFLHELGHVFLLADEYSYYTGCSDSNHALKTKTKPANLNIDNSYNSLRWKNFRTEPKGKTVGNSTCATCLPESAFATYADTAVGAFEGAGYFRCKVYRPSPRCRMRDVQFDFFCEACRRLAVDYLS